MIAHFVKNERKDSENNEELNNLLTSIEYWLRTWSFFHQASLEDIDEQEAFKEKLQNDVFAHMTSSPIQNKSFGSSFNGIMVVADTARGSNAGIQQHTVH